MTVCCGSHALHPSLPLLQPEIDLSRDDFDERYTAKGALAIDWDELTFMAQQAVSWEGLLGDCSLLRAAAGQVRRPGVSLLLGRAGGGKDAAGLDA